jgi:hypothetical protein
MGSLYTLLFSHQLFRRTDDRTYELRNVELEGLTLFVPPLARDLLMSGDDQIPARARGQVTWNRGLQIERGFID